AASEAERLARSALFALGADLPAAGVALQRAAVHAEQVGGQRQVAVGGVEDALDVLVDDAVETNVVDAGDGEIGERELAVVRSSLADAASLHPTRTYHVPATNCRIRLFSVQNIVESGGYMIDR